MLALGTVSNTKVFNKLIGKKVFNSVNYYYLSAIIRGGNFQVTEDYPLEGTNIFYFQ